MLQNIKYWIKLKNFKYATYNVDSTKSIKVFWWRKQNNFGDLINYDLIASISKKKIEWVPSNYSKEYDMAIGSILQLADDRTIVWGSGLISDVVKPLKPPKEILAVRGPLTRKRLLNMNIKCPEIYGDPALLISQYFMPKVEQKYELGIIPHFVDKNCSFFKQPFTENIKIIDIERKDPKKFVEEVLECKKIISSALHGIIISDAYDVPALRVKFSRNIAGGDFKFNDYYFSIEREIIKPFKVTSKTKIEDLLQLNYNYYKKVDLEPLIKSCPFNL